MRKEIRISGFGGQGVVRLMDPKRGVGLLAPISSLPTGRSITRLFSRQTFLSHYPRKRTHGSDPKRGKTRL
jgi:hypothetical protein